MRVLQKGLSKEDAIMLEEALMLYYHVISPDRRLEEYKMNNQINGISPTDLRYITNFGSDERVWSYLDNQWSELLYRLNGGQ